MREKVKNLVLTMMPAVLLAVWAGYLLWQISAGMPVKIKLRGYDPRDLLAGQYISYVLDWEATDCASLRRAYARKTNLEAMGKTGGVFMCRSIWPSRWSMIFKTATMLRRWSFPIVPAGRRRF
ncbi:MAG: hypothetical protein V8R11_06230 [Alphaproteobacteria bacterium]